MNEHRRALRDFQDALDDVSRASYATFDNALRRLAAAIDNDTPLGDVAAKLAAVDFDTWYQAQLRTVGGMAGSGTLDWPVNRDERLSLQLAMLRRIASGHIDVLEICINFISVRNDFNDNVAEFIEQVIRPFARDFLRQAHDDADFERALFAKESVESTLTEETPVGTNQGLVGRLTAWVNAEKHRRGPLWGAISAILALVLAALALVINQRG